VENLESGLAKMFLIWRTLSFRKQHRDLFLNGDYTPLVATGLAERHVCAFSRAFCGQRIVVLAPRLTRLLMQGRRRLPTGKEVWGDTRLSSDRTGGHTRFRNVLTGATIDGRNGIPIAEILNPWPVALMIEEP